MLSRISVSSSPIAAPSWHWVDATLQNLTIRMVPFSSGSVQRDLSAANKAAGLSSLGRAADKRYSLGLWCMHIFDLIYLMNPTVKPDQTKIHLATWNGQVNPIDVYLAGEFNEWQRLQTRKNFKRTFVLSLISLPGCNRWLFAGVHISKTPKWLEERKCWYYELEEDLKCSEMNGRMVATFSRSGRQSYLNAESWSNRIILNEVFTERISIREFPGFKAVNLTKAELNLVFRQSLESWRAALSNVAGVYLISDTATGKLYVGSASGEGGIWQRWESYASDGHGGNVELRKLLNEVGDERAKHFRYSILEIADTHASKEDILCRESHWKKTLLSREYGLNAN